jgi:hypothetical protein
MSTIAHLPPLAATTPAIQAWDEQLRLFGRVTVRQRPTAIIVLLVFAIAILAAGVVTGAREGSASTTAIVMLLFGALLGVPAVFWLLVQRNKTVVVETDGVRLLNGYLLPWEGIEFAGIWSHRSNHSVAIQLTGEAMRAYTAQQSPAARMLTKTNAGLTRSRAVFLPSTLEGNAAEFALWLNMLLDERLQRANASDEDDPFA